MVGNEARFINDYRGGARIKGPNVEFRDRVDAWGISRIGVYVLQNQTVRKGEELCISYGKSFWKTRGLL
jgi:SET domain-containing protein